MASEYCWLNPALAEKKFLMCPFRGANPLIISTKIEESGLINKIVNESEKIKFPCLKYLELNQSVEINNQNGN